MQKYISIDSTNDTTNTKILMTNKDNEVHGTLKTKDAQDNDEIKDVNEIFVNKKELDEVVKKEQITTVNVIDMDKEEYSLETVASTLNSLITALKGGTLALAICMLGFSSLAADPPGKQKLGTISAKTYVVTNEVDPVFSKVLNSDDSIALGKNATGTINSVAIGTPLKSGTLGGPQQWGFNVWNPMYIGTTEANDRSVAIGDAAKSLESVSVAIGNQANVHGLHSDSGISYTYKVPTFTVTTTKDSSGNVVNVETGKTTYVSFTVDTGKYERLPYFTGNYKSIGSSTEGNVTTTTYEGQMSQLYDISYIDENENDIYDRIIQSGQGPVDFRNALYGVAVGSRAYVSGYHGAAFGHYAHVSRPNGLAIGSEAHSYSEGGQAIGFDTDIATNSPFSLAVGMNASIPMNTTNAIVIGVPDAKTDRNNGSGAPGSRPTAMKSNSINFVYHGDGLNDFFIDNKPITDRMATEISMIGSSKGTKESIETSIKEMMGIPKENQDMVFFSGNGGLKFFTMDYIDEIDNFQIEKGNVESIEFNGMSLPNIIAKYAPSNETGVVEEIDPIFNNFKNNNTSVALGNGSAADYLSVAIGNTLDMVNDYKGGNKSTVVYPEGWSKLYTGPTESGDRSVAIGDAAKAIPMVSVAIGNQANVRGLHTNSGSNYVYKLKSMTVTNKYDSTTGNLIASTTNENGTTTITVDTGIYERLPIPSGEYSKMSTATTTQDGIKIVVEKYQEKTKGGLYDMSYLPPEEFAKYNIEIDGGQGQVNFSDAIYGIALGSRAYVAGYHSLAIGHWTHASRPHTTAIGSGTHIYSEGSIGMGYDTDVATNSPYSLAIGSFAEIPSGMTNAIVIGMPTLDWSKRETSHDSVVWDKKPKAMKSNSINIVYNGEGLNDFFIDSKPITERLASEVKVIGNTEKSDPENKVVEYMKDTFGVNPESKDMVFFSESNIRLFSSNYPDNPEKGDASTIEINGMPLSQVIEKYAPKTADIDVTSLTNKFVTREEIEGGLDVDELEIDNLYLNGQSLTITNGTLHVAGKPISSDESKFEAYHTTVTNQARIACESISNTTDLAEIKTVLMNFFNNIK